jgi:tetratricopeptide (TPR) repeat protein
MDNANQRGLHIGAAVILACMIGVGPFGPVNACASQVINSGSQCETSPASLAEQSVLLPAIPSGCVLILECTSAGDGTAVPESLHQRERFEESRLHLASLRDAADTTGIVAVQATRDCELPSLICRQPPIVQEAWRQISSAIEENEVLPTPRPEPLFARAELWMMVGGYDAALRDLLAALRTADNTETSPRVYTAIFERIRDALERYESTPVPPEDGEPARHYGRGVHLFWSGVYSDAEKAFTNALLLAPDNPLYWYMRALTHRKLGKDTAAEHDVLLGVAAETKARQRNPRIPSVTNYQLRRVQGPDRTWLENHRQGNPSRRSMAGFMP